MSARSIQRPRLVSSLRWRLSTAITGVILLVTVACVASAVLFLRQTLTDRAQSDLRQSLDHVSLYMRGQQGELLGIGRLVASDPLLVRGVQDGDRQALVVHLSPTFGNLPNVDIVDVVDAHGRALVRMENTSAAVAYVGNRPSVRAALHGQERVALETDLPKQEAAAAYALRATVPILRNSQIVGALIVGRELDSIYAGRIGRAVNADVNLIVGNQRTGTTLTDAHGLPITGISEPRAVLDRIAHRDTTIVRTQEDGQTVFSGLVPLAGPDGRPAGAIEVVSRLDPLYTLITQLAFLLIAIGAVVVVLGTLLALDIARRLTRRLQILETTASHVAEAASADAPLDDLHPSVPVSGSDEIASLARSVSAMMDALDHRMAANARLYDAAQARVRELTGLAEIARLLTAVPSVGQTLDALGERVCHLVGCSAVAIWVPGDESIPALHGGYGLPEGYEEVVKAALAEHSGTGKGPELTAVAAMRTGQPLSIRFEDGFEGLSESHARLRKAVQSRQWATATALPLLVQGRSVGAITCYNSENQPLTESDLGLLMTIADQLAVSVENMRLYAESRDLAALEERARLARELHDSVTQALFSMTLHTRAAEMALAQEGVNPDGPVCRSISQLHDLTRGALAEMRALIFELRPGALQEEGLVEAVRKHVAAVSAREGVNITVEAPEERVRLEPPVEEHLYRVVQEAVHNVVKHAAATDICIRLDVSCNGRLTLEIIDDGVGFDTETVPPGRLGLSTMAGRISQIDGSLHIISSPGQGTTVRAVVPCAWPDGEAADNPPRASARGAA